MATLVHQELVTVNPQTGPLTVRLPAPAKKPSAPGTVSMTQLRHPPDRKAFQAFAAAQRFSESGQTEKAVEELEKAVRISPELPTPITISPCSIFAWAAFRRPATNSRAPSRSPDPIR